MPRGLAPPRLPPCALAMPPPDRDANLALPQQGVSTTAASVDADRSAPLPHAAANSVQVAIAALSPLGNLQDPPRLWWQCRDFSRPSHEGDPVSREQDLEFVVPVEPVVERLMAEHRERRQPGYAPEFVPWEQGRSYRDEPWD